ncbi:hypothetical protein HPC49_10345 [Pyxidicoccus fallax]|uniref:Metallo-beta-lactamase domain-containing protein n=1 Tax=Pyxidicoccus fallax TaxID=394095 RepID=A0A848LIX3_9BACT|nr:hypothetical protein [Pyxidicoccus fallax]NMO17670.1 hypothetical protein [Pyxidicoccus fallax]NPC78642.1 hypothetical protein [Pyxidicoccus fallax]
MDALRVRTYNVRFGDALLVSVPDHDATTGLTTMRHLLIDVGNVQAGEGGADSGFLPVLENVLAELDGAPLDLYVMTHEHLDHVQGLPYADERRYGGGLREKLKPRHAWLTASAAPDYYERHPEAKKQLDASRALYDDLREYCQLKPEAARGVVPSFLLTNDYRKTDACVEYLRGLAERTHYVHRGAALAETHPFKEARLEVWAPEEDTSEYYGRFMPVALGLKRKAGGEVSLHVPAPPAGVDASAFYNLLAWRCRGVGDDLLAIDKAANNTSIVFSLEWRGWRLLFAGDAEVRSWKTMKKHGVLKPVHFLKVSHHGSHNGTPDGDIFDAILPVQPPDGRQRTAVISAYDGTYNGIPHAPTNERLRSRCALSTTLQPGNVPYLDLLFEDVERTRTPPRIRRAVPVRNPGRRA